MLSLWFDCSLSLWLITKSSFNFRNLIWKRSVFNVELLLLLCLFCMYTCGESAMLTCPSQPMLSVWGLVGTHTAKTGSEQQLAIVTTASDWALSWEPGPGPPSVSRLPPHSGPQTVHKYLPFKFCINSQFLLQSFEKCKYKVIHQKCGCLQLLFWTPCS